MGSGWGSGLGLGLAGVGAGVRVRLRVRVRVRVRVREAQVAQVCPPGSARVVERCVAGRHGAAHLVRGRGRARG